ncbi:MAG: carbonic anhydrase family protein, partial [Candidatus Accumulibacter sp.]|nr:carbonic anhydrase family protein [Accumulibacter sp.]
MSAKTLALVLLAALPGGVWAAWQTVATEQGRRIEIDRESVAVAPDGAVTAKGRIVLDKPLV